MKLKHLHTLVRATFAVVILGSSALTAPAARADDGNPLRGQQFAEKMCTGCHAVHAGEPASPLHTAPSFTAVANSPGLTALALTAFFRTSHKNMPNFIIPADDTKDVIAYILSLKVKP